MSTPTQIDIKYSTGEKRKYFIDGEVESEIKSGCQFSIKTMHPMHGEVMEVILHNLKELEESQKIPNVIFGVLTNGEIFVEIGGEQFTPADSFYKMATIQSSKLSHQVRDLELKLSASENKSKKRQERVEKLLLSLKVISNTIHELEDEGKGY